MDHIGAGLAALGVIGPGIGIGILGGLAATRDRAQSRRRRPDPRPGDHPRGLRRRPRRPRDRRRPARDLHQASPAGESTVDLLATAAGVAATAGRLTATPRRPAPVRSTCSGSSSAPLNFIVFLALIWTLRASSRSRRCSATSASRIEQGLRRRRAGAPGPRERARPSASATLGEARREANDILDRAQKVAQEIARRGHRRDPRGARAAARPGGRGDRGREAARDRRPARPRSPTSPCSAAGQVVGETMTDARQRRLVEEFLGRGPASAAVQVMATD